MDQFKTIRPYNDDEVSEVIARLSKDDEFIRAILKFRFPQQHNGIFSWFLKPLVVYKLRKFLGKIKTIKDLQLVIADYLQHCIDTSMDGFVYTGCDGLDVKERYLFIANHRDIVMDPALINYAIYLMGHSTLRIAIGDNLLQKPYVADLMRLNKSFVVQRSVTGRREKLAAYQLLSQYINHSILEDKENVWIAQAEGRAKDGNDVTDPALIKMLHMSRKQECFSDVASSLNILPVSISYEYDPCDLMKAKELYIRETQGEYIKQPGEDDRSIALGITGYKGRVHIHFGDKLGEALDAKELAAMVDQQVYKSYHLFPVNYLAYAMWEGADESLPVPDVTTLFYEAEVEKAKLEWQKRLNGCPEEHKPYLIKQYAYPVYNKYSIGG